MPTKGHSLPESLVVLTLIGLTLAVAVPAWRSTGAGLRLSASARELALSMIALRWKSVASHRSHGLWFLRDDQGWGWVVVRDGNGNGLRTEELRAGVDLVISPKSRPSGFDRGIRLGIPRDATIPRVPPAAGTLTGADSPIRFGSSGLVSFSPLGSASSGSIYLADPGGRLAAVVVFGPTARVRIWHFEPGRDAWRP